MEISQASSTTEASSAAEITSSTVETSSAAEIASSTVEASSTAETPDASDVPDDGSCTNDADCAGEQLCYSGTCQDPNGEDECVDGSKCETGICEEGTCSPESDEGKPCSQPEGCRGNTACHERTQTCREKCGNLSYGCDKITTCDAANNRCLFRGEIAIIEPGKTTMFWLGRRQAKKGGLVTHIDRRPHHTLKVQFELMPDEELQPAGSGRTLGTFRGPSSNLTNPIVFQKSLSTSDGAFDFVGLVRGDQDQEGDEKITMTQRSANFAFVSTVENGDIAGPAELSRNGYCKSTEKCFTDDDPPVETEEREVQSAIWELDTETGILRPMWVNPGTEAYVPLTIWKASDTGVLAGGSLPRFKAVYRRYLNPKEYYLKLVHEDNPDAFSLSGPQEYQQ